MYIMDKSSLGNISNHLDQIMRPSASPRAHKYGLGVAYITLEDDVIHDIIVYYISTAEYILEVRICIPILFLISIL